MAKPSQSPVRLPLHQRMCTTLGRRVDEETVDEADLSLTEKFKRFLLEKISDRIHQLKVPSEEDAEEGELKRDMLTQMNTLYSLLQDDRFEDIALMDIEGVEGGRKIKRGILLLSTFMQETSLKRRIKLMQLISRNEVSLEGRISNSLDKPAENRRRRASKTLKNSVDTGIEEDRSSVDKTVGGHKTYQAPQPKPQPFIPQPIPRTDAKAATQKHT